LSYQALYRSWRPQTFADFVGQPHVKQTLMNAITRGQVAHAYLFCGPRGTGKTSAAKVLAKAVNCMSPLGAEPCNECPACQSILTGNNVDVEEIDAASNRGVDEIRQLRDKVHYAPADLKRKVYIVDEVHMLTTEAFNALLKTLEEPPGHTLFILATTEPHKIPGTIVSRCQRFDFRRIAPEVIVERLQAICVDKGWAYEDEAMWKVAEAADGGLRDALGLLEQTAAFGHSQITAENAAHVMGGVESASVLRLVESLVKQEPLAALQRLMQWYEAGKDAARIVQEILQVVRDLFIVKLANSESDFVRRKGFPEVARVCSQDWLLQAVKSLGETYVQLRYIDQPRLALEAAILGLIPGISSETEPHVKLDTDAIERSRGTSSPKVQAPTVNDKTVRPDAPSAPPAQAPPAQARPRQTARSSAARKMEVLQALYEQADEQRLGVVRGRWDPLLQRVKSSRIQTHAWLMNGQPVLATPNTVVIAFSSRIHRDAVMKPDEREAIETALSDEYEAPMQFLALLQSDWDAFLAALSKESEPELAKDPESRDLAQKAIELFGEERVVITDKE
jgi:DNA polymerase III subunit gamma/tau